MLPLKKNLTILLFFITIPSAGVYAMQKKGHAILILGTSSAGKSKVHQQGLDFLKKTIKTPIVSIIMDETEDQGISNEVKKQFPADWRNEHIALHKTIINHTSQGKIALCDLMLFTDQQEDITESFIDILKKSTSVVSILVYCHLNQLLHNVSLRNSLEDELNRRSPLGVVQQYREMYLSCSGSSKTDHEEIATLNTSDVSEGIKILSILAVEKQNTNNEQAECRTTLDDLSSKAPSPVLVRRNLYDFKLTNTNNGNSFDQEITNVFNQLVKKINAQ